MELTYACLFFLFQLLSFSEYQDHIHKNIHGCSQLNFTSLPHLCSYYKTNIRFHFRLSWYIPRFTSGTCRASPGLPACGEGSRRYTQYHAGRSSPGTHTTAGLGLDWKLKHAHNCGPWFGLDVETRTQQRALVSIVSWNTHTTAGLGLDCKLKHAHNYGLWLAL